MMPRAGWGWWLTTSVLACLTFLLLRNRIESVPRRGLAALAIVAVGGVILIALAGAVRGIFDRPR